MARISRRGALYAAALAAIAVAAVFARTWHIVPHGRIPDTYEQMTAARRLLAGELPLSDLYPPGIALVLALFFAVFPDTINTLQAVVVLFSLVLVGLAYVAARCVRADRATTVIFVAAIAISPAFVTMSRVGLFDAIGTALLVSCIFAAPAMRRAAWPAWLAFALVLSLALSVRLTNVFVLPALVIAYAGIGREGNYRERLRRALNTRPLHVIGLATLAITFLLLVPGLVSGSSGDAHLTLRYAPVHVLFYQFVMLGGLAIPIVAPMALVGAARVWRAEPSTLMAMAYVFLVWPVVHAPFHFVNERYMLLPLFFALLLAAHGPAEWWRIAGTRRPAFARMGRMTAVMAPLLLAAVYVLIVGQMLRGWGDDVGLSDESALEELRPVVAAVDEDALVVTAIARGFDSHGENREYFDLIDHRIDMRDRTSSVAALISTIDRAIMEGRAVYYVYSRFEEDGENAGLGGAGIDIYFSAVQDRYAIRETFQAQQPEYRLYRVMPQE